MPRPKNVLTQMFPPKPAFTDKDVGDLTGKVYIVTGGSSGVGRELARILYAKGATVFIAVRSEPNAEEAMAAIRAAHAQSAGKLEFLSLDLADLEAVAAAAQAFLARADRLDVLFNNAGVMHPPAGSKTKQGHELQLGVHNLGPVLLTELLTPLLARTAAAAPAGSVRVVWVASLYADLSAPPGGFEPDNIDYAKADKDKYYKYSASKAGNYYQGTEYARRHGDTGILSVCANPGNLKTNLQRHHGALLNRFGGLILHPAVNGAYTELFAGLSPEITAEKNGTYIIPWGRTSDIRADLSNGAKSTADGGTGMAEKWYTWCLETVAPFMKT